MEVALAPLAPLLELSVAEALGVIPRELKTLLAAELDSRELRTEEALDPVKLPRLEVKLESSLETPLVSIPLLDSALLTSELIEELSEDASNEVVGDWLADVLAGEEGT